MNSVRELLIDEMRDLYDAEKQLVKALPKVAKATSSPELGEAVTKHLEQTRGHVERLERAFEILGAKPRSKPCQAMNGLIEEARETMEEDMPQHVLDCALICAAQKVEHYEIAGSGTVKAWATALGFDNVAELLDATLQEEKAANDTLTDIAAAVLTKTDSPEQDVPGEHASKKRAGSYSTVAAPRRHAE
jgi:ferritin-like metal-binding protein YciE